jgi:hypothetical protein
MSPSTTRPAGPATPSALPGSASARQACPACGQVLTVHYLFRAVEARVVTRVPCVAEGCRGTVRVAHPRGAYALWVEGY